MTNTTGANDASAAGAANANTETEEDKKRLRQQERTVDNLNRLFAMLFSVVFSIAAASITQKIVDFSITKKVHPFFADSELIFFNAGALFVLATTAAVFFHQASRGLDLTYSSSPRLKPHPGALAVDFGVISATMVPFVLMARSLDKSVTDASGLFLFFFAHEALITFGLVWVIIRLLRFRFYSHESVSDVFRDVSIGVERFWLVMNSAYIFFTSCAFMWFSKSFTNTPTCPVLPHHGNSALFVIIFIALATLRNCADYFTLFNVFFPVKPQAANGPQVYKLPLRWCINAGSAPIIAVRWPTLIGLVFFSLAFAILFFITDLYDVATWTEVCDMTKP